MRGLRLPNGILRDNRSILCVESIKKKKCIFPRDFMHLGGWLHFAMIFSIHYRASKGG